MQLSLSIYPKSSLLSYCLAILTLAFIHAVLEHTWFVLTHCTESRDIQIGHLAILPMQMIFLYPHFFIKIGSWHYILFINSISFSKMLAQ